MMTEPGADPRARGGDDAEPSAVDRYVTRIGKLYGSLATEQLDDLLRVGSNPLCTRAALWQAVVALESCAYDDGFDDGRFGMIGSVVATKVARQRVRELLGMEPES